MTLKLDTIFILLLKKTLIANLQKVGDKQNDDSDKCSKNLKMFVKILNA